VAGQRHALIAQPREVQARAMDIIEAIERRQSIRAFKPDPVSKETLRKIMEVALRAPSWANTQPWEFAIVTGRSLREITEAGKEQAGVKANPDFPGPEEFPEPYNSRFLSLAAQMSEVVQASVAGDQEGREWYLLGPRLYGAPAAIYIYTDRSLCHQSTGLNVWPVFDCGLVAENILLLAAKHGLGAIALAQAVHYPDILRQMLGISDSKLIVLGIAIGYPDWENPVNRFRSEREAVDSVVRWYGFG
jgi:nitroreductase